MQIQFNFSLIIYSGKAGEFVDRGDNTYGGKYVVNPSGGLISKGHPLGATGLCFILNSIKYKIIF
jgi:acetyl-CoA acetyltransferase